MGSRFLAFDRLRASCASRNMRGMHKWTLVVVARPGTGAANQPLPQYAPGRRLGIERLGTYMKVIPA